MSAVLALLASLVWGTADFVGGTASRRSPVTSVLAVSELTTLCVLVPLAFVTSELSSERGYLGPGMAAGLIAITSLGCFYRALAIGTMGVVAPIASLGVAVPVTVGLVGGDRPGVGQLVGVAVAVVGIVLASGPELRGRAGLQPLILSMVSGAGFGTIFVLIERGARTSTVMTLLAMRLTSGTVLIVLLVVLFRTNGSRPTLAVGALPLVVGVGLGNLVANGSYAVATQRAGSLLSVTAVLASLYPVVTVLLARRLHAEHLRPVQSVGVAGTLVGVVLLAAG